MAPILINTAEAMAKMKVVSVKDDSEKILKVLQKLGVLHAEESHELNPVDRSAIEQEHRQVNELYTHINRILSYLPQHETIDIEEDVEVIYTRPFSEISDEIRQIYNRTKRLQDRIDSIDGEYQSLKETEKYLHPLSTQPGLTLKDLNYSGRYLSSRIIVISADSYTILKDTLKELITENFVTHVENETILHIIADTRNIEKIQLIVNNYNGVILDIPAEDIDLSEYLGAGAGHISSLEDEKTKLTGEITEIIGGDLKKLVLLREALSAENERLSVLEKASEAKYVTVIEGWVPRRVSQEASVKIKEDIDYAYIDIREPEDDEEPPVEYKNPKAMKPFQIIVNMFATPQYREWDPTPVITYSFAFFFGLMVCDVLYAIGLFLLARFALAKFTDDPYSDTFKQFQRLLYTCSAVALVGGLLSGQYFGDIYTLFGLENGPALVKGVQEALQDPMKFIIVALLIGFIHINLSHILAFIKAIKQKDKGNILAKLGLALLQCGIPGILHSILGANIPLLTPAIYSILNYVMIFGIVLIFVSSLMINKGLGAILWLFDITGLLGDVMSYARLAGVGLATFYLAMTFNLMADLFSSMMSGVIGSIIGFILALFIIVVGHTINLVLTAITGFMHSLRLCFVEFLFKFYEGGGTEYSPFRFVKRSTVNVNIKS